MNFIWAILITALVIIATLVGIATIAIWFVLILPLLAVATIVVSPFLPRKVIAATPSRATEPERSKDDCPDCGAPLHPIRSQFMKMCGSCDYQEPWDLKPGQKPLIGSNRDVRK